VKCLGQNILLDHAVRPHRSWRNAHTVTRTSISFGSFLEIGPQRDRSIEHDDKPTEIILTSSLRI
jgi:hypothetical protein